MYVYIYTYYLSIYLSICLLYGKSNNFLAGPFQFNKLLQLLNNQLCKDSTVSFFWRDEKGTIINSKW